MFQVYFFQGKQLAPSSIAAILCVLFFFSELQAQMTFLQQQRPTATDDAMGLLSANETRLVHDLNGTWQYRENGKETWSDVIVPSSWKGSRRVLLKRDFTIPSNQFHSRVFQLVALSISHYCEISINGQFIGKHVGLTSFSFNISPGILKPGRNTIEVFVHNELNTHESLPPYEQLWDRRNYGGIVHDIALVARRGVWVQETYIKTTVTGEARSATLSYKAYLNSGQIQGWKRDTTNGAEFGRIAVTHQVDILDAVTSQVLASSEAQRITVESDRLKEVQLSISLPTVRLWSPDTPNLYILRQRTYRGNELVDEAKIHVGFKSMIVQDNKLLFNGEKFFLKAVTYMEDSPRFGRSMSFDEMERDVLLMKNLGVNAVRLYGGSIHPYFLNLCDRYGLLVLQEVPMTYAPSALLSKSGVLTTARNLIREMISRDNWHVSFASLGLGQGLDLHADSWSSVLRDLSASARKQHDILLHASFFSLPANVEQGVIDLIGLDLAPMKEDQALSAIASANVEEHALPVFLSSLRYAVETGNYNGYSDPRSIDAQAQFHLNMFRETRQYGFAGIVVHSFADYAVSKPIMTTDRIHEYTATVGIVDRFRQKRLVYDILKASYNNEKPPVLNSGKYDEIHPPAFVIVGIVIIFIFAVVYNLFRRFRENVVRSFLRPYNFFADVRDQRMLSIFQTSMVGLLGALSAALLYANFLFAWRSNVYIDHFISQLVHQYWLKQWVNYSAWNPLENLLVMSAMLFVLLLVYALFLRAAGFMTRKKVFLFDAYSVAMWSVLPMIMLAPLGMVLYRILELPIVEFFLLLLYVAFHIWIASRLLKGTAIVFDIRPVFFYLGGVFLLAGGGLIWLLSLDSDYLIFSYLRYFARLWMSASGLAVS
jgi:beta-galactosidase